MNPITNGPAWLQITGSLACSGCDMPIIFAVFEGDGSVPKPNLISATDLTGLIRNHRCVPPRQCGECQSNIHQNGDEWVDANGSTVCYEGDVYAHQPEVTS